jgi:hypothetical protein
MKSFGETIQRGSSGPHMILLLVRVFRGLGLGSSGRFHFSSFVSIRNNMQLVQNVHSEYKYNECRQQPKKNIKNRANKRWIKSDINAKVLQAKQQHGW